MGMWFYWLLPSAERLERGLVSRQPCLDVRCLCVMILLVLDFWT